MFKEIIDLLNNNQGVLAFISLLITAGGFGIVVNSINNSVNQPQKNGDNGINQAVNGSGTVHNSGNAINTKK